MEHMERELTLDRFGNGTGMLTPWGRAQATTMCAPGLLQVETAGHGGFLLSRQFAEENLSEAGRKRGMEFNAWLAYEEDSDANIVIYELGHLLGGAYANVGREELRQSLESFLPGYLAEQEGAAGEIPTP